MKKRSRIFIVVLVLAVLCAASWQTLRNREPLYRGKKVRDWLEIYCLNGSNATLHFRAVCNLIDLGTNSVPHILDMAATRDSTLKKNLLKIPVTPKVLEVTKLKKSYNRWASASTARPKMVARAFLLLGRENQLAVPGLIHLLSSDNPATRLAAANMLQSVGGNAGDAEPALLSASVHDSDPGVRTAADQAIAAIRANRRPAVSGSQFDEPLGFRQAATMTYYYGVPTVRIPRPGTN